MHNKTKLDIYTDASGNIKSKMFGYAAVFIFQNTEYYFAYSGDQNFFKSVLKTTDSVSNPTVELFAVERVLCKFACQFSTNPVTPHEINIYSDYIGVRNWLQKKWNPSKPYIKKLVDKCTNWLSILKHRGHLVNIHWVKGHAGIILNERADELACKKMNESNLTLFFIKQNQLIE